MKEPKTFKHWVAPITFPSPVRCTAGLNCNHNATHIVGWHTLKKRGAELRDEGVQRPSCVDHALDFADRHLLSLPPARLKVEAIA